MRRLKVLVAHLPTDSAVARVQNPDHPWGLTEHLLALLFDSLQVANWQRGYDPKKKPPPPDPLPRPGVEDPRARTRLNLPPAEMAARLRAQARRLKSRRR